MDNDGRVFTPQELIDQIRALPEDARIGFGGYGSVMALVGGLVYRFDHCYPGWVRTVDVGLDGELILPPHGRWGT